MNDIYIYRIALPMKVHGTTVVNDDASYTVYINSLLSPELQAEAEAHERYHIEHDHLYEHGTDIALQESLARSRPDKGADTPRHGFVRRGEHLLYWEMLASGQTGEEIREGDMLKRAVPCRTRKADIDIVGGRKKDGKAL